MKDEDFTFKLAALLGFSLSFFPGLLAGMNIAPLAWRSLVFCIIFSLIGKFGARILFRMHVVASTPTIEELREVPQIDSSVETQTKSPTLGERVVTK
jgi:pilus assembly protein TadC